MVTFESVKSVKGKEKVIEPEKKKKTTQTGGPIAMATLSLEKGKTPTTTEGEEALTMQVVEPGCQIEDPIDLEKEVRIPSTTKCVPIPDVEKVKTEPVDKLAGYKTAPKTAKKKATKEVGEPEEEEIITSPKLQREEQPLRKQKVTEETLDKGKTDAELQPATITTKAFPDQTEPVAREECISTFITTESGLEGGAIRAVQSGVTLENVGGEQSIPEQEEIEDLLLQEKGEEDTRDAETIRKVDGRRTMVETYLKRVTKAMRADADKLVLQCQAYQDQEMVELRSQLNVKEANLLDLKDQLDAVNANKEQEILELKRQLDAVKSEKQQEVHARELLAEKVDTLQRNVYDDEEKQDQWRKQYHQDLQQNNAKLREELKLSHEGTTAAYKEVYKRDKLVKTVMMEKGTEVTR
ncbi:unnamed protein product [Calypogeia fissa]